MVGLCRRCKRAIADIETDLDEMDRDGTWTQRVEQQGHRDIDQIEQDCLDQDHRGGDDPAP